MALQFQQRGDTAAQWTATNPILAEREIGLETDTLREKIGDGASNWNALPYRREYATTVYTGATQYTGGTEYHVTELDTVFNCPVANHPVLVQANISYEAINDGLIFMQRGGVEVGSAPTAGLRNLGMVPLHQDGDNISTMKQGILTYPDIIPAAGPITYSFHFRLRIVESVGINRTNLDSNADTYERAISTVTISSLV